MGRYDYEQELPILTAGQMCALILDKQQTRKNRNEVNKNDEKDKINICVFPWIDNKDKKLRLFFEVLAKNIENNTMPEHFKVLIKDRDLVKVYVCYQFQLVVQHWNHWFAVDCLINDGQFYLMVMDAYGIENTTKMIMEWLPASSFLKPPMVLRLNSPRTQYASKGCRYFALLDALRCSKQVVHWLDFIENYGRQVYNVMTMVELDGIDCDLAFRLQEIQNWSAASSLLSSNRWLGKVVINKKKTTLDEKIKENFKGGYWNRSIGNKATNWVGRGLPDYEGLPERFHILGPQGDYIEKNIGKIDTETLINLVKKNFIGMLTAEVGYEVFHQDFQNVFDLLNNYAFLDVDATVLLKYCNKPYLLPLLYSKLKDLESKNLLNKEIIEKLSDINLILCLTAPLGCYQIFSEDLKNILSTLSKHNLLDEDTITTLEAYRKKPFLYPILDKELKRLETSNILKQNYLRYIKFVSGWSEAKAVEKLINQLPAESKTIFDLIAPSLRMPIFNKKLIDDSTNRLIDLKNMDVKISEDDIIALFENPELKEVATPSKARVCLLGNNRYSKFPSLPPDKTEVFTSSNKDVSHCTGYSINR